MSNQLEQQLTRYYQRFQENHDQLREQFQTRLAAGEIAPAHESPSPSRRRLGLLVATAATLIVGVLLWQLVSFLENTPYAQAMEILEHSSSLNVTVWGLEDGRWVKNAEIWFDQRQGLREWRRWDGREQIRIDNGTFQWTQVSGRDLVVRTQSMDPVGVVRKLFPSADKMKRLTREPLGDCTLNGVPCRQFVAAGTTYQNLSWLDDQNRLHRSERRQCRDGQWTVTARIEVAYDLKLDAALFRPDFGDGVRIVEADHLFNGLFSLEKAIYTHEDMGLILAIHELKPVEDDMVYLVFSVRATEETNRRLGPLRSQVDGKHLNGSLCYGDMTFYVPAQRLDDDQFRSLPSLQLASCYNDGVNVQWLLVARRGPWPEQPKSLPFGGNLHTRLGLADERQKAGLPTYKQFFPLADLPLSGKPAPLSPIVSEVYEQVLRLEPSTFQIELYLGSRPLSEKERAAHIQRGDSEEQVSRMSIPRTASPQQISVDEWEAEIRQRVRQLLK